ncbi:MAG: hypothetical protein AAFN77_09055 [Planctomycetota bacterium]
MEKLIPTALFCTVLAFSLALSDSSLKLVQDDHLKVWYESISTPQAEAILSSLSEDLRVMNTAYEEDDKLPVLELRVSVVDQQLQFKWDGMALENYTPEVGAIFHEMTSRASEEAFGDVPFTVIGYDYRTQQTQVFEPWSPPKLRIDSTDEQVSSAAK